MNTTDQAEGPETVRRGSFISPRLATGHRSTPAKLQV